MRVKVKNIQNDTYLDGICFVSSMRQYVGTYIEVEKEERWYRQVRDGSGHNWCYAKDWLEFEKLIEYKVKLKESASEDDGFLPSMKKLFGKIITVTPDDNNWMIQTGEDAMYYLKISWLEFIEEMK